MRIFVDENIPNSTIEALRDCGHDVVDIRHTEREGADDTTLWELAQVQGRLFVTTDNDFKSKRSGPHAGLIIITLRQPNGPDITRRAVELIDRVTETDWPNTTIAARDVAAVMWTYSPDATGSDK